MFDYRVSDSDKKRSEKEANLIKQCFFLNLYNALILFKMAEIATLNSIELFSLETPNSWLALEQNSFVHFEDKTLSAYQIKH